MMSKIGKIILPACPAAVTAERLECLWRSRYQRRENNRTLEWDTCQTLKNIPLIRSHAYAIWAAMWENRLFAYAKTKTQISCAVTAQLISAFVFATQIVSTIPLLPKFKISKPLAILSNCAARFMSDLDGNPEDRFSHVEAHIKSYNAIFKLKRTIFDTCFRLP